MIDQTPLTDQQLDDIEARAAAATPGPWRVEEHAPTLSRLVVSEDSTLVIDFGYVGNRTENDAKFTAHAREDVPALVAEVRRLRAAMDRVKQIGEREPNYEMTTDPYADGWNECREVVRDALHGLAAEETHVVADDSDDPEHVDDCPGCEAFTLTGHRAARPVSPSA